jgi:hypothetical protein
MPSIDVHCIFLIKKLEAISHLLKSSLHKTLVHPISKDFMDFFKLFLISSPARDM